MICKLIISGARYCGLCARPIFPNFVASTAAGLAAAIGGIAPRGHHQRHVVMRAGVGDGEADRHDVEERRIGRRGALAAKIGADVEGELDIAARASAAAISGASVRPSALVSAVATRVRAPSR